MIPMPPQPPPGYSLYFSAANQGIVLPIGQNFGYWPDQSPNSFEIANGTYGFDLQDFRTLNGVRAVGWTSENPPSDWYHVTPVSNVITASAWTIGVIWQYTGSATGSSFTEIPTLFMDENRQVGVSVGSTSGGSPAAQLMVLGTDGSGNHTAQSTGASGTSTDPHFGIVGLASGELFSYLDDQENPDTWECGAMTNLTGYLNVGRRPYNGGDPNTLGFQGGLRALLVYPGNPPVADLKQFLKTYGNF